MNLAAQNSETDLFGKTLRTVAVLVGSCVVFVGVLSLAAVLITSKAVSPSSPSTTDEKPATASPTPNGTPAKKPVSI